MIQDLNEILIKEHKSLKELSELLEEQFKYISNNEIFSLEEMVHKITLCNKEIAKHEVSRRRLLNQNSIKQIIDQTTNEELKGNYIKIQTLLNKIKLQKDSNEILIKQQLSLTNNLLRLINPNREAKGYNAYGKISR